MKFCGLIVIASHAADGAILHEFTLYKHNKQMLGNCNKKKTQKQTLIHYHKVKQKLVSVFGQGQTR